jgi:hypothetical protein
VKSEIELQAASFKLFAACKANNVTTQQGYTVPTEVLSLRAAFPL